MNGGRSRDRTYDPLIKSQMVFESNQRLSSAKSVKPATIRQWDSSDLSNPIGARCERPARSFGRFVLGAFLLLSLGACAPSFSSADWSVYVSKSKTLQFIASASCDTPKPFNPVGNDATFFQIGSMAAVAGQSWQYDVVYQSGEGWRQDRFDIKQWWSLTRNRNAPASAWHENQNCAVIAEIPRSMDSDQPYYVEPAEAKAAEHGSLKGWATLFLALESLVLVVALVPCLSGYEQIEKWAVRAAVAAGIIFASFGAFEVLLERPWETFQVALRYQKFFDELPRAASGYLLPLSPAQLYFLIAGPPHPNDTQFAFTPLAIIGGTLTTVWLVFAAPAIVRGIYWLTTPLPVEELHEQALREGRAPTAPEIKAAVLQANVGKEAWQLNIMRQKADAFAKKLSNVVRHL
jgi:hypothetical protein